MSWSRLDYVSPLVGQHVGVLGEALRPDENFNAIAENIQAGREAFLVGHTLGGGHDDPLISRGMVALTWNATAQRHETSGDSGDVVLVESDPSVPGLTSIQLRRAWPSPLGISVSIRSGDLAGAATAVQAAPNRIQIRTFRRTWLDGVPTLEPRGHDVGVVWWGA